MKIWIKDNFLAILVVVCLTGYVGYTMYQYNNNHQTYQQFLTDLSKECEKGNSKYTEATCTRTEKSLNAGRPDTFTVYFDIQYRMDYIGLLLMTSMIAVGCYQFSRKYKTGFFKYELQRMNYFTYLKSIFKQSLKNLWIILYYVGITFLFSFLFSRNFNVAETIEIGNSIGFVAEFQKNLPLFLLVYLVNLFLNGIFYINLGMLWTKKSYNYLVNVIASILTFFGLMVFFMYGISGVLFHQILHVSETFNNFDLLNFWTYLGKNPLLTTILNSIFVSFGSCILLWIVYRKREELVVESEEK